MASTPLSYEYERDDYYCYPDSTVLKNELGIEDEKELDAAERKITSLRIAKLESGPLEGELDFDYVKRIHKYLFDGIYEWAGEARQIDISKGNIFCQHELIEVNAGALFQELKAENYLLGLDEDTMAGRLAHYLGDLNTIHPFREGNGRVQRILIRELAARAGFLVNFSNVSPKEMIEASDAAFHYDYEPMEKIIAKSIKKKA